jgi:hypothetical protein
LHVNRAIMVPCFGNWQCISIIKVWATFVNTPMLLQKVGPFH